MATHTGNRYLNLVEMTDNAQYILNYLVAEGWTKNAVCGMLGNMQSESTINPGIWQGLNDRSGNLMPGERIGFGLVQWDPYSKYIIDFAQPRGYQTYEQYGQIDPELLMILNEVETGAQWIATTNYPLSFQEFTMSTETPEYLAMSFVYNYERPANPNQPNRATQARYWYDTLVPGVITGQPRYLILKGNTLYSPDGKVIYRKTGVYMWILEK